jgi:hypothetical protein
VNVEYYRIFRRSVAQGPSAWQEIGEVHAYENTYTDENPPGPPGDNEYKVVSIDEMGWESTNGGPDLAPSLVRLESSSCPGSSPITARIRNLGAGVAPPPVRVAFYDG